MNWAAILSTILPALLQLLNDPAFQAIIKAVEGNMSQKIAAGTPAGAAAQQATGLLGAAAMLHLTGNPIADFQAFAANFKVPPTQGTFTS